MTNLSESLKNVALREDDGVERLIIGLVSQVLSSIALELDLTQTRTLGQLTVGLLTLSRQSLSKFTQSTSGQGQRARSLPNVLHSSSTIQKTLLNGDMSSTAPRKSELKASSCF